MSGLEQFAHKPVLLSETIESLIIKPDGVYLDGTVGGAGHSREILQHLGASGRLICLDRDEDALQVSQKRLQELGSEAQFDLVHANFSDFDTVLADYNLPGLDGVLLDLGVSSWQLDEAERGFSYMKEGPLDMRMDKSQGESAADVIARISPDDLADIFYKYGEEKNSRRIAQAIVNYRDKVGAITTTKQLADIIVKAQPAKSRRANKHPAKRCFQALRIYVNDELGDLEIFLEKIINYMNPDGRICLISFHSLEDKLLKQAFRKWEDPCECPKNLPCVCGKKPLGRAYPRSGITASEAEVENNPRARSCRLRVFVCNAAGKGN